jgi:hypothetical protein
LAQRVVVVVEGRRGETEAGEDEEEEREGV